MMQMQQRRELGLGLGFGVGIDSPLTAVAAATSPAHGKASGKRRLQLVGVNMDCSFAEEEDQG